MAGIKRELGKPRRAEGDDGSGRWMQSEASVTNDCGCPEYRAQNCHKCFQPPYPDGSQDMITFVREPASFEELSVKIAEKWAGGSGPVVDETPTPAFVLPETDAVNSPAHYTQGHLETIYVIEQTLGKEGFKAYCMGNWIKYNQRHAFKNGAEDLAKAEQYLSWAVNGLPAPVNGRMPR